MDEALVVHEAQPVRHLRGITVLFFGSSFIERGSVRDDTPAIHYFLCLDMKEYGIYEKKGYADHGSREG